VYCLINCCKYDDLNGLNIGIVLVVQILCTQCYVSSDEKGIESAMVKAG
jgi:hypothetical protein